jgi:hypothetical protein
MLVKTKPEIAEETVVHYKTNPRGFSASNLNCVYYNPSNGAMCGVGRCCIEPKQCWSGPPSDGISVNDDMRIVDKKVPLDELLKPEYRGHDPKFWDDIQMFHDINSNWKLNDLGGHDLTSQGYERLEELLQTWKDK